MQITKYGHACFSLAEGGGRVIIDPGTFTELLGPTDAVEAIVVTHNHFDHWSAAHLSALTHANPDAVVFTTGGVATELEGIANVTVIEQESELDGGAISIGGFELRFFLGQHAQIHASVPQIDNVGVLVNDAFFYPGDSFAQPGRSVQTLAVPVSAPWLKIGEVMDYVAAVKAARSIPTHDALLSDIGYRVVDNWVKNACESARSEYVSLKPGESV